MPSKKMPSKKTPSKKTPSKNKTYRVELGINLHTASVPQTNPNMRIFPLQNALIDVTDGQAKPAWYAHLGIGDTISFRVVDISNLRVPERETEYPDIALAEFYFNNPRTGKPANPFTEQVIRWQFSERFDGPSPPYCLNPDVHLPSWDLIGFDAARRPVEPLTFADFKKVDSDQGFRAFELTVAIKTVVDGWVNHYVFDPEMIVSDTDSEGPGGGTVGGEDRRQG